MQEKLRREAKRPLAGRAIPLKAISIDLSGRPRSLRVWKTFCLVGNRGSTKAFVPQTLKDRGARNLR